MSVCVAVCLDNIFFESKESLCRFITGLCALFVEGGDGINVGKQR